MASEKELRNLFVLDVLDRHGDEVVDLLQEQINSKKLIQKEELLSSLEAYTERRGDDWVLSLKFKSYGRAIEIRYHKKTERKWQTNTNKLLWERSNRAYTKRKKDTRWYSKTVYGTLNSLIGKLSYGFTEEEKQRLVAILEQANQQNLKFNLQ